MAKEPNEEKKVLNKLLYPLRMQERIDVVNYILYREIQYHYRPLFDICATAYASYSVPYTDDTFLFWAFSSRLQRIRKFLFFSE